MKGILKRLLFSLVIPSVFIFAAYLVGKYAVPNAYPIGQILVGIVVVLGMVMFIWFLGLWVNWVINGGE